MKTLQEVNEYWEKHCLCQLRLTTKRSVPGAGDPNASIIFIGEAPGKKEDETGLPFVGAAGKFLDEMLHTIKIKREEVYITSIVKYRPPENRDPTPKEKDDCQEWLHEQINTIKPFLVVFLGRHSMNHFFPELKISEAHGTLIHASIPGINPQYFLPLYHPAAALYNGGMRAALLKDFKNIPLILKKVKKMI